MYVSCGRTCEALSSNLSTIKKPNQSKTLKPSKAVHTCNPNIQEAEARRYQVQGQPELHREFQARLGNKARACFKNKTKT
jgi:hypothetical protein